MLLRPEIVSESRVFFHEGAHLLDGLHEWRDSHDWAVFTLMSASRARSDRFRSCAVRAAQALRNRKNAA